MRAASSSLARSYNRGAGLHPNTELYNKCWCTPDPIDLAKYGRGLLSRCEECGRLMLMNRHKDVLETHLNKINLLTQWPHSLTTASPTWVQDTGQVATLLLDPAQQLAAKIWCRVSPRFPRWRAYSLYLYWYELNLLRNTNCLYEDFNNAIY